MRTRTLAVVAIGAFYALFSNQLLAVVDLDEAVPTAPVYARETLSDKAITQGAEDGVDYYNVSDPGSANDVVSKLGVSFVANSRFYVRYTLTNGVLAEGHAAALVVDSGSADVIVSLGGSVGDSFIIFAVTATSAVDQTATAELTLGQLAVPASGAVGIAYELYSTPSDALYQNSSFYRRELATYIRTAASASASFTPGTNTADVDKGFSGFTSASIGELRANVGSLEYKVTSGILAAGDGAQVELPDIVNESATEVALKGDFSFGVWTLDDDPNCGSPDISLSIDPDSYDSATATLADFGSLGYSNLCVEVDGESDVIPSEEYFASAVPEPLFPSQLFSASKFSGAIGLLEQNGTVVKIPQITTFSDYRQRIVLVNHRDLTVDYAFSFITEAGVVATPLDAASGTLLPNTTLVLQADEVVSLSGGSRCSANLSADARVGSISVSTTQVNLLDGSTDTVVY